MISRLLSTSNPQAAPSRGEGRIDLRDFFEILRSRALLIGLSVATALLIAFVYLAMAPRIYTGVTSILIDTRSRSALGDPANTNGFSPDAVLVESQVKLISSASVLRRVVEAENLGEDGEFVSAHPGLRTRLWQALGLTAAAPPSSDETVTRAMIALASHVVVNRSERTYIADIAVTSRDPLKAARLSNAVARAYLADQQAARTDAAGRDSEWVRGQIAEMQAQLQDAEVRAQTYKQANGIIDTNGKILTEQELADASAALTLARSRTTEVKARLDQIQRINAAGLGIDTLPDAIRSPTIEKLRTQYAEISRQQATLKQTLGSRHPALLESDQQLRDVRRLIADELRRVQSGLTNEYETAQANVQGLERHVLDLKKTNSVSNESRVRLDELQRDVDARRAVYDRFLRARDTVREQAVDAPIGRIIAPAIAPTAPSSPRTTAVLLIALGFGLGAGVGGALLLDLVQGASQPKRVGETEVEPVADGLEEPRVGEMVTADAHDGVVAASPDEEAAVPMLGFVPSPFGNAARLTSRKLLLERLRAAWPTTAGIERDPAQTPFRASIEALGIMDPNQQASRPGSPSTVVVTSLEGCVGRTTFALGLAEAAAAAGRRALVIDADERGGLLRDLVTIDARPALIDVMGTKRLCYKVVAPHMGGISIVPIMPSESQIARRLAAQSDAVEIAGIGDNYDLVIFDGPSVARAAQLDALAVSVDLLLLVAPKDATRAEVNAAIAELDLPSGCSVAAVLVADVDSDRLASEAA